MKKLIFQLLCVFFISANPALAGAGKPLAIRLVIDNTTTAADLNRMSTFLAVNGYALTVEYVRYNSQGGVEAICADVDFKKSSGSFESWDLSEGKIVVTKSLLGAMSIEMDGCK